MADLKEFNFHGDTAMEIRTYQDLVVWQRGMDLAETIYLATEPFPKREWFGLSNQMRRSSVSIASNVAEGQARGTTRDFIHFLLIAKGSLQELETQTILSHRLKFLDTKSFEKTSTLIGDVGRPLSGLIQSLRLRDET